MPNLNFLVFLNSYSDINSSNNPSLNNFKWDREINGLSVQNPQSLAFSLAPGETRTMFNGTRTLLQDNTTAYSLSSVALTSNTYQLSAVSGTLPNFRTPRATGADATTQLTATQNGPLITVTGPAIVAVAASFTGQVAGMTTNITLTADHAGVAGNSIMLTGDGTSSITTLVAAWNTANPSNTVSLTSGDGTQIPSVGAMITLAGGINSATALNLAGVQVGDLVRLGSLFNPGNQGEQKIISVTATSFTVANELGVPEGPFVLGSGFASQLQIYSAAGVQVGDMLVISGGFSPVTQGSYVVTSVAANYVQFYTTDVLPIEGPITTEAIAFYSMAKTLVYLEADQICSILLNGSLNGQVSPLQLGNTPQPGIFMNSGTIYSMAITNNSTTTANLFLASAE
jgi:hypothetical protein